MLIIVLLNLFACWHRSLVRQSASRKCPLLPYQRQRWQRRSGSDTLARSPYAVAFSRTRSPLSIFMIIIGIMTSLLVLITITDEDDDDDGVFVYLSALYGKSFLMSGVTKLKSLRTESHGAWWLIGRFITFRPKGRGFKSHSSRRVGTLGKSFTRSCLWHFGVKLWHSIRVASGVPLSSSGLEEAL